MKTGGPAAGRRAVAEAPGKIIITGEHFVVHGAYALAAAIDLRVRAEATRSGSGLRIVSDDGGGLRSGLSPVERAVRELYAGRGVKGEPDLRLRITSRIPAGSGLGSSASTMVACVAAACRLEAWGATPGAIVDYAMVGERAVHGNPSGIDVNVSALGGVVLFRRGDRPLPVRLRRPVRVLVVHSGMRRETGRLISKVSSMKEDHPAFFSGLCEATSYISRLAGRHLARGEGGELGRLLTYNHAVLGRVGASNERLDEIVDACISAGCLGAKLTGAGGGGSVIAIAEEGSLARATASLRGRGYDCFSTTIPCGGVRAWTA